MNLEQLKQACGQMLSTNDIKPGSQTGKKLIYAYWQGVMAVQGPSPFVGLCLASGRFESLVEMPK